MNRADVRYWLYRFQTEVRGGAPSTGAPDGLRAQFEVLPGFTKWDDFAKTWDVSDGEPWKIVQRKFSEHEVWEKTVEAESRVLKIHGDEWPRK